MKNWWGNTAFEAIIFGGIIFVSAFIGFTAYNLVQRTSEGAGTALGLVVGLALAFFGIRHAMRLKVAHLDAQNAAAAEHRKAKKLAAPEGSSNA